jgi:hypothetical protein
MCDVRVPLKYRLPLCQPLATGDIAFTGLPECHFLGRGDSFMAHKLGQMVFELLILVSEVFTELSELLELFGSVGVLVSLGKFLF